MTKKKSATARQATTALARFRDEEKALILRRFFKTAPGEYGAGDRFLGVQVPKIRSVAKAFQDLPLFEIQKLLKSKFHEERLLALLILVLQFQKLMKQPESEERKSKQRKIVDFYLKNLKFVNNWDLVDSSAPYLLGPWFESKNRAPLFKMIRSSHLWTRRIGVMSSFYFIRKGEFNPTLKMAKALFKDPEDLIHKAVGWMLREIGNRSPQTEIRFLDLYASRMPRTMLRYAIEKLPERQRKSYLSRKI